MIKIEKILLVKFSYTDLFFPWISNGHHHRVYLSLLMVNLVMTVLTIWEYKLYKYTLCTSHSVTISYTITK